MDRNLKIDVFAMPHGARTDAAAVHVSVYYGGLTLHQRLSEAEAEDAHARLGSALSAIKLGRALTAGADPRDQERRYRAKLAIRLGLTDADVRAVFDLSEEDYARLASEVRP